MVLISGDAAIRGEEVQAVFEVGQIREDGPTRAFDWCREFERDIFRRPRADVANDNIYLGQPGVVVIDYDLGASAGEVLLPRLPEHLPV